MPPTTSRLPRRFPSILFLVESAFVLCPGKPVWLGPCTIGVRHNPYGAATQPNPSNLRVPSATVDPRQSALFGAAYAVAAAAQAAASGVETVTLGAPGGVLGIFNANGATPSHQGRGRWTGLRRRLGGPCALAPGFSGVYGIAYRPGQSLRALVANLTAEPVSRALPASLAKASLLRAWRDLVAGSVLLVPPLRPTEPPCSQRSRGRCWRVAVEIGGSSGP